MSESTPSPAPTSAPAGPRLGRMGQIGVGVEDLEGMTAFYRDVLGIPFLFAAPGMSFFDCGGVRLMLSLGEGEERHAGSIFYFAVDDIAAAYAGLQARGLVFEREPHVVHRAGGRELWLAFFRDPERNFMGLMSEVPAAA